MARAAPLAPSFIVRSSSASEDGRGNAAPGVFETVVDVDLGGLEAAIAAVRASAHGTLARAYAEAKGLSFPTPMTVLIQPYLAATANGTVYTRLSEQCDDLVIDIHIGNSSSRAVVSRGTSSIDGLSSSVAAELCRNAVEIDTLFAWPRGADVEWLVANDELWLVQARPLTAFAFDTKRQPPGSCFEFSRTHPAWSWAWDISHNPEPLSEAQCGLVRLVASELSAPLGLACGYLYEGSAPGQRDRPQATQSEATRDLEHAFFADVGVALDERLLAAENGAPDLGHALSTYLEINRLYAEVLRPKLRAARHFAAQDRPTSAGLGIQLLEDIGRDDSGFGDAARTYARTRAARGHHWYWSPYADRWDVECGAFDEYPPALDALVAAVSERPEPAGDAPFLERLVHAVSELDDRLFYRGQRLVRRAILALPGPFEASRFDLDLEALLDWAERGRAGKGAAAIAKDNREERERARLLSMPLEVEAGAPKPSAVPRMTGVLTGAGSGTRCRGRVTFGVAQPSSILVAVDLTPGSVMKAASAAAIVLEHGSLLGHAAALARELGIPIVTNVSGATSHFREGEQIWVDGAAGLVVRLD